MDAHAEASTHISHVGIAVDAAEQSETVDDEDFRVVERQILLTRSGGVEHFLGLSITNDLAAFQEFLYLLQVVLANDVRGDDELPVLVLVEIPEENLLVGRPR